MAPFFEVYESTSPFIPPTLIPYSPEVAGPVSAIRFGKLNLMATTSTYRRSEVPGIGNPATPDPGGLVVFSPEDNFVLVGGSATSPPVLYRRVGPYYMPITGSNWPGLDAGVYALQAAISNNGQVIAIVPSNDATKVLLFDKQGVNNAWTAAGGMPVTAAFNTFGSNVTGSVVQNKLTITPDSAYLLQLNPSLPSNAYTNKMFKYNEGTDTYETLATPSNLSPVSLDYRADGVLLVAMHNGTVWSLIDGVWAQLSAAKSVPTGFALSAQSYVLCAQGTLLLRGLTATANTTGRYFWAYQWTGSDYATIGLLADASVPTSSYPAALSFVPSRDGKRVAVSVRFAGTSTATLLSIFDITGAAGAYTQTRSHQYTLSTYRIARNFSPDGTRINLVNQFFTAQAPYQELTTIPEAPGVSSLSTVSNIFYGSLGQVSLLSPNSGALLPVIRDGAGAYLDVRVLEGTFVSVWDRLNGHFRERGFVQHLIGTVVSDLQFSPNGKVFSYHTERPDSTDQSGLGRFIYDISLLPFISYRGVMRFPGDVASRIAFDEATTYAVVVFDGTTDNVQLLKFGVNYTYAVIDTDLVPYGIPAFSKCDTVVVAHGGPQPYTLYSHLQKGEPGDRLEQVPVLVADWNADSKIFAAAFMPDCSKLIIVTDEEIHLIDPESGEEEEEPTELEQPLDPEDEVEIEPDPNDNEAIIIENPGGDDDDDDDDSSSAGPGSGPGYETDGNSVSNISYLPYASINITFKTWP